MSGRPLSFRDAVDRLKAYIDDPWLRNNIDVDLASFSQREPFDFDGFCLFLTTLDQRYETFVARFIGDMYGVSVVLDEELLRREVSYDELIKYSLLRARNDVCIHLVNNRIAVTHPHVRAVGNRVPVITTRRIIVSILNLIDIERSKPPVEMGADLKQVQRVEDVFNEIIQQAMTRRVSDIHIEYNEFMKSSVCRFRKDGILETFSIVPDPDAQWHLRLANHIMVRANLNAGEYFRLHDAQIEVEVAKRNLAVRVSIVPMYVMGKTPVPQFCLRIMASEEIGVTSDLVQLGFFPETANKLRRLVHAPNGMILVCGPTGSGKNTTLYALLDIIIRSLAVKIISIEDPVEKKLRSDSSSPAGIVQIEVNPGAKIGFADALRSVLRHDPDVIFVGEIRDVETAEEAVKAGITGHLVFSTLHTNSSFDVIPRLTQTLKVHPTLVESVLRAVLSQRLVRKLCPYCARFMHFGEIVNFIDSKEEGVFRQKLLYDRNYLEQTYLLSSLQELIPPDTIVGIPIGCPHCAGHGFVGRTVLWDLMVLTPANRERLFRHSKGEVSMYLDPQCEAMAFTAVELVKRRITSLDEVERFVDIVSFYEMYRNALREEGLPVSDQITHNGGVGLTPPSATAVQGQSAVPDISGMFRSVQLRMDNFEREIKNVSRVHMEMGSRVRELEKSINELRSGIDDLTGRIRSFESVDTEGIISVVEGRISASLTNLYGIVKDMESRVESLSGLVQTSPLVETASADLNRDASQMLNTMVAELTALKDRIREIPSAVEAKELQDSILVLTGKVDDIEQKVERLSMGYQGLSGSTGSDAGNGVGPGPAVPPDFMASIGGIQAEQDLLKSTVSLLKEGLDATAYNLESLRKDVDALMQCARDGVSHVASEVERTNGDLLRFDNEIRNELAQIRDALHSRVLQINDELAGLNRAIAEVGKQVSGLSELVDHLGKSDVEHQTRIGNLESRLGNVEKSLHELQEESNRIRTFVERLSATVSEMQTALYEQIKSTSAVSREEFDSFVDSTISDVQSIVETVTALDNELESIKEQLNELTRKGGRLSLMKLRSRTDGSRDVAVLDASPRPFQLHGGREGTVEVALPPSTSSTPASSAGSSEPVVEIPVPEYREPVSISDVFQLGKDLLAWDVPYRSEDDIPDSPIKPKMIKIYRHFINLREDLSEATESMKKSFFRTSAGQAPMCMASQAEQDRYRNLVREVCILKGQMEWYQSNFRR